MPLIISDVSCIDAPTTIIGQLQIVDTAAHIATSFSTLNSLPNILSVTSNDGVVTLDAPTFNSNTGVVGKMPVQSLRITCPASDIPTYTTVLNQFYSSLESIVVSGSITLTYLQYLSLSLITTKVNAYIGAVTEVPASAFASILATTNATVTVKDTAANITTYNATTASNNRITSSISTTSYTCQNYLSTLNANSIISDTASNFTFYLSQLESQHSNIVSITLSGSLSLPFTSYSSNQSVINKLTKEFSVTDVPCSALAIILTNNLISVYIKDIADSIYANLSRMTSYVKGIIVSSGSLSVDYDTFITYMTYLRMATYSSSPSYYVVTNTKVANLSIVGTSINVQIKVVDLVETIKTSLSTLQSRSSSILEITPSDGVVLLDFFPNYGSYSSALKKITNLSMTNVPAGYANSFSGTINSVVLSVSDTNTELGNNLHTMSLDIGKITAISVKTGGVTTVETNCQALNTYIAVFKKFGSSTITLTDSATNIVTYYDTVGLLTSQISVVNTTLLSITYAQYQTPATSIFRRTDVSYKIIGTGAPCSVLSALSADAKLSSFIVNDTSAEITSAIATLQNYYSKITSITTDNVVVLTAAQFLACIDAIGKMADASISIRDTNAGINLNSLTAGGNLNTNAAYYRMYSLRTKIKLIHCTDTLVLDYQQQIVIRPLLSLLETAFTVPNAKVDSVIFANANLLSIVIHDVTSSIIDNLSLLKTYLSKITSITATDSSIQFSYSNYLTYSSVAAKMTNSITVTNVPCSAASIASQFSFITISDTGENIVAYAQTLNGLSNISTIFTSSRPTFTYTQYTTYTTLIPKLGQYLLITSVSVSNAAFFYSTITNFNIFSIEIADLCSAIIQNMSTLSGYCTKGFVSKITSTDACVVPLSAMTGRGVNNVLLLYWNVTYYISNNPIILTGVSSAAMQDVYWSSNPNLKAIVTDATVLANIQNYIGRVASFSFTTITNVSYSELTSAPNAVAILPSYTVSRVPCANALSVYNSRAISFTVVDTPSNVQAFFPTLMNCASKLTGILASRVKLTYAQYSQLKTTNLTLALLSITDCPINQASLLISDPNIQYISIVGSVSEMQGSYLNSDKVLDITLDGTYFMTSSTFATIFRSILKLKTPSQVSGAASTIPLQNIHESGTTNMSVKVTSGTFNCAQLLAYPGAYAVFTPDSVFSVSSAPCSSVATLAKISSSCLIAVYDTASNITDNLLTLAQNVSNITGITASEASTIAKVQVPGDILSSLVITKIQTFFDVTGANCTQLDTMNAFVRLQKFTLVDTGANIASSYSKILLYLSKIASITASTSALLTFGQFNTISSVIQGNVTLINVPCANLPIVNPKVIGIAVEDTSLSVLADISKLTATNVSSVKMTQGSPITITAAYALSNKIALAKFPGTSLIIRDTIADLATTLPSLETLTPQIRMAQVEP